MAESKQQKPATTIQAQTVSPSHSDALKEAVKHYRRAVACLIEATLGAGEAKRLLSDLLMEEGVSEEGRQQKILGLQREVYRDALPALKNVFVDICVKAQDLPIERRDKAMQLAWQQLSLVLRGAGMANQKDRAAVYAALQTDVMERVERQKNPLPTWQGLLDGREQVQVMVREFANGYRGASEADRTRMRLDLMADLTKTYKLPPVVAQREMRRIVDAIVQTQQTGMSR